MTQPTIDELAANIGQDKSVQNPQDAIDSVFGTYADSAANMSEAEKVLVVTPCPDKAPFKGMSGV